MKIFGRRANGQGNALLDAGKYQAALERFQEATKQAPNWSVPWYNLGLTHKRLRNWQESQACNKKATELNSKDEAAWWNLGIASTALGDWETARFAWKNFGIELPEGDGPIQMDLGPTPIRLNLKTNGEVVWCQRIDPARAVIRNVPFAHSGHRYGDLLLHDGEPNGSRQFRGQEVPVFDQLAILEQSPYSTFEVIIDDPDKKARMTLVELLVDQQIFIEDWSTVRMLCDLCSRGKPHDNHTPQAPNSDGPLVRYGIASRSENELIELLKRWELENANSTILEFDCVLLAEES